MIINMKEDLISVIVPFYNVEKYASKCILSIISQTYKNLEIILIDDGSPDNCGKIIDEFSKKDDRIIPVHKKNGGLSDARNAGIDIAKGKYISFVDSDDYIANDMIEYMHDLIKKYDADISICGVQDVFENENIKINLQNERIVKYDIDESIKQLLLDKNIKNHAWDKLYKKELFADVRYPIGKKMEDIGTTYKLFKKSNLIVSSNQIKYFYLQRNNGIMMSGGVNLYKDYYELTLDRYNDLKKCYPNMQENDICMLNTIILICKNAPKELFDIISYNDIYNSFKSIFNNSRVIFNLSNIKNNIKYILFILFRSRKW